MIPTEDQAKQLWDRYDLPEKKRVHVELVARVARFLVQQLTINNSQLTIDQKLLIAGALLHDIDKNVSKLSGERHPDTGVRILREEGMGEVADVVKTHSLHMILDDALAPRTWEQKLLFLADKMVKQDIIGVDARFTLWNDECMAPSVQAELDAAYPKVKALEAEIFGLLGIKPSDVAKLAQ